MKQSENILKSKVEKYLKKLLDFKTDMSIIGSKRRNTMRKELSKGFQLLVIVICTIGLGISLSIRTLDYSYVWFLPTCIFCGCFIGYLIEKKIIANK